LSQWRGEGGVPLKSRDVKRALKAKGFVEATKRDHWYYFFYRDGKKSDIYTKISRSDTDLHDGLCSAMAAQIRLTDPQFRKFVDCVLTAEIYLRILLDEHHL